MQNEIFYWVCFGRFSLREKLYLKRRLIRRFAAPSPTGEGLVRLRRTAGSDSSAKRLRFPSENRQTRFKTANIVAGY